MENKRDYLKYLGFTTNDAAVNEPDKSKETQKSCLSDIMRSDEEYGLYDVPKKPACDKWGNPKNLNPFKKAYRKKRYPPNFKTWLRFDRMRIRV